ncbi:MAG: hypothetical protein OQK72_00310, partial [Gammaproteobacteria bacterium]|nr:hypothetical protein [Gammaproteobacteria bacterium]
MHKLASLIRRLILFCLIALSFIAHSAHADTDDQEDHSNRLADVRAKIAAILGDLNENKNKRNNIKDQLQIIER